MNKFKIGDKVRVTEDSYYFKKGDIGVMQEDSSCPYITVNNKRFAIDQDRLELYRSTITWDNFEVGDILVNSDGDKAKILARLGDVFWRSVFDDFYSYSMGLTIHEAKKYGWTFKQPVTEEVEELTVEEISKRLGKTIKVVN